MTKLNHLIFILKIMIPIERQRRKIKGGGFTCGVAKALKMPIGWCGSQPF